MKAVFIVCAIALFAAWHLATTPHINEDVEDQFQEFVATYRKSYASKDDYGFRLGVFNSNLQEIAKLSALNPTAKFGVNEFADMTLEERNAMLGYKPLTGKKSYMTFMYKDMDQKVIDHSKYMTKVKNQGSCGSCWAFSAVQSLESGYAMSSGNLIELSPQQFVDCVHEPEFGSEGCNGGWMDDVFDYSVNHKLCTEKEYKYTGRDGKCQDSQCTLDIKVKGRHNIPEGNLNALLQAAEKTPLAIAIDASPMSFYRDGVLHIKTQNLNHGVQLVGYDLSAEDPYLVIRNSWGERWGLSGYVKVSVNDNGGATLAASFPKFDNVELSGGLTKCKAGEDPDAAKNCYCTFGEPCDKTKEHKKNGCDDECGCGEFGFCR